MIDTARLRRTFLDLLAINSPPGQERECARYCLEALRDCGFVCQTDSAGNVIAQKLGTVAAAPRIFFSAHTDTVEPTLGLVVEEANGHFRASGGTILGADDKAGLAQILEAVRCLGEQELPHGDLLVVLSTGEEVGLLGAKALATEVIAGSFGFVFDGSGPSGALTVRSPTQYTFDVRITGRAAHAGVAPELGVSALRIGARAVDRMPLGRIDDETTANVGVFRSGSATNVVPESAWLRMEARSHDRVKLDAQAARMREAVEEAARELGGAAVIDCRCEYAGYAHGPESEPLRIAAEAWRRVRAEEPRFRSTGGGSDANVFNARGVPSVVLSTGYIDPHSVDERISFEDLAAGAEWGVAIARVAAER